MAIRSKPAPKSSQTKGKSLVKAKRERDTPRVSKTEPKRRMASAQLSNKQSPKVHASGTVLDNGEVLVSAVLAETVPIAEYANVIIGPAGFQWKLGGIDMGVLADVDWDDDSELTPEQQRVFDKACGALRATIVVVETVINEDRETVERAIRQHNEREASEKAKSTSSRTRRIKK